MNVQESNEITVSDIQIKVEKFEEFSSVIKSSVPIIPKESSIEDNFSLKDCSFVKCETLVFKTEEDDTCHELTDRESSTKENFSLEDCSFVKHETVVFKTEEEEDDTFHELTESKFDGNKIVDEHSDELRPIIPEEIYIKNEVQEEDHFNIKYIDPDYEESLETFRCRYCCTGLSTEKYKIAHERRCKLRKRKQHLGESVFECSYCKLLFTREEDKNNHQVLCMKRKESERCEANTRKKIERKYYCDKCSYETKHKSSLVSHIRIHDEVNAWKYPCSHCPYQTNDRSNLRRHLRMHNLFGLICIFCQKSFKQKVQLDAHYVSTHPERSDKWSSTITHKINECPICKYKTVNTSSFKRHLAIHGSPEDQGQFKCHICAYKCIEKSTLGTHLRLHVDQLPFVCVECDQRFNVRSQLDGHIITRHSENGELISSVTSKVHQCKKCSFKTVYNTHFKKHSKTCLQLNDLIS